MSAAEAILIIVSAWLSGLGMGLVYVAIKRVFMGWFN